MKKIFATLMLLTMLVTLVAFPVASIAEGAVIVADTIAPDTTTGDPFTWEYLATIAGAAAFTLLVVQFLKVPIDRVWKIPTRVFAYIITLAIMLVATAFTTGLTAQTALLATVNAFIAALTAMGAYEITFAKMTT